MNVTISARHCEIPESLRAMTQARVTRLERLHPRMADAEVTFERERTAHDVEIRVVVEGESPVVARASADTFRSALERGLERIARQLQSLRERRSARRHASPPQ